MFFGLLLPYMAQYDVATGTYSNGFKCGKAISINISPTYAEGSAYGDNQLAEYLRIFRYAALTLGVTTLPAEASTVVFGHSAGTDVGETEYNQSDAPNFIGIGLCRREIVDGILSWVGIILVKCMLTVSAEDYTTQDDNIVFTNPNLEGRAMPDANGVWKKTKSFTSETDAAAWIKTELNIPDPAQTTP